MNTVGTRPRVLHVITHFALGGAERVALNLAHGLRSEFAPAILAAQGGPHDDFGRALCREARELDAPIFTGPGWRLRRGGVLVAGWRIHRAVTSFQPDLVHLHTEIPELAWAVGRPGSRLRARPLVRTVHNSQYWHHWRVIGRWTDRRLAHARVAGVSTGALVAFEALRRASGAPPPPAEPVVIFNGVAPPIDALVPLRDRLDRPGLRLLFAGRFDPQKGTDLLPDIVRSSRAPPGCTVDLVCQGSGAHEAVLRELSRHPPPGWSIQIRPPAPALAAMMASFDAVLMPSRFEGLSLVAIEAMLAGVPLIATDAPGLKEQLPPGQPWIARAGDAASFATALTLALAAPPEQRAASADAARTFAMKTFSLEAMLAGYRELYRRALQPGSPTNHIGRTSWL